MRTRGQREERAARGQKAAEKKESWTCLVTEVPVDSRGRDKNELGKVPSGQATKWRLRVVEGLPDAPEGWTKRRFDDSHWTATTLPMSWRLNHTALLRGTFTARNKRDFEALRIRGYFYRQQGILLHISGKLIAKVDKAGQTLQHFTRRLNPGALKALRNGENTIAVTSRNNWRWGIRTSVHNAGFGFRLDALERGEE